MLDCDPRMGIGEFVRDATARAGDERLAVQRIAKTARRDPDRRAMDGEERSQLARSADQSPLIANDVHGGGTKLRVHLHTRIRVRGEQQKHAEQMVEAAAFGANDDDPLRLKFKRRRQCKLEIGRVLVYTMPFHTSNPGQRLSRDGVEIADQEIHLDPQHPGKIRATVRSNDRGTSR